MPSTTIGSARSWVIGYGNPHRRDDGIGIHVVESLRKSVEPREEVFIHAFHQLEPVLIDELQDADSIIFVDATVEVLKEGFGWVEVQPEKRNLPFITHHLTPSVLLGLLQSLYHRSPPTWLVSVQGEDFGFGEGLSVEAAERAERASRKIADFISVKID